MRVVEAPRYHEPRDALAQSWWQFLAAALPDAAWMPVPNLGAGRAEAFCEQWALDGLILSGGDDIGVYPVRDETERALIAWAADRGVPVLGICRGMQVMGTCAGTVLRRMEGHAGTRHRVRGAIEAEVNSYHAFALEDCPAGFEVLARSEDGALEAMRHRERRWEAWMWHPEREPAASDRDIQRMRDLFE